MSPRPHPNLAKVQAATARWIAESAGRSDAADLLNRKAAWVAEQIATLGREDLATPPHLEGLTVWDLQACQFALEDAARNARRAA